MALTLTRTIAVAAFAAALAAAQAPAASSVADQMVVTVIAKNGGAPDVKASDLVLMQGKSQLAITGLQPLRAGVPARMELFIAIDDDAVNLNGRMAEIKSFVNALPSTVVVGVAYMRGGSATISQPLTPDHAKAAAGMRQPAAQSGVSPSPLESISAIIKNWKIYPGHRAEMLVFTDGIQEYGENNSQNDLLDAAIATAQQAGVEIYGIWCKGAGTSTAAPLGHSTGAALGSTMSDVSSTMDSNIGQGHLQELTRRSGGEIYSQGEQTPTNLEPYLKDIADRMNAQYRLKFTPAAGAPAGLAPVKLETTLRDVILSAPAAVVIQP